jgi:HK97 family phage major capsid protein
MSTHQLKQRRAPLISELRTISEAGTAAGALTNEQSARVDELRGQLDMLDREIGLAELIEAEERRSAGIPLHSGGADAFANAAREVTVLDVLRAAAGSTDHAAGRAREVSAEIARREGRQPDGIYWDYRASSSYARAAHEQRVFGTLTPAAGPGGALVQTTVSQTVIDMLTPKLVCAQLGCTTLSGLIGNLAIPRVKQWPSTFWVAENSALTVTDPGTEQVPLTPHHTGAVVELTRQLMMQSSPDAVRLVENILSGAVAQAIDQAALVGGGAGQPNGILSASSGVPVIALGTNGAAPTWNALVGVVASVDTSNALQGRLAWCGNAKTTSVLRRTLKTTGDTSSNFILGMDGTLIGYPMASTQNIPSNLTKGTGTNLSAMIFGDWSALIIGYWSALDIALNTQGDSVFLKGNAQIRAMATCDVALMHAPAFAAITDMVTT